jgi:hypothetical protein
MHLETLAVQEFGRGWINVDRETKERLSLRTFVEKAVDKGGAAV